MNIQHKPIEPKRPLSQISSFTDSFSITCDTSSETKEGLNWSNFREENKSKEDLSLSPSLELLTPESPRSTLIMHIHSSKEKAKKRSIPSRSRASFRERPKKTHTYENLNSNRKIPVLDLNIDPLKLRSPVREFISPRRNKDRSKNKDSKSERERITTLPDKRDYKVEKVKKVTSPRKDFSRKEMKSPRETTPDFLLRASARESRVRKSSTSHTSPPHHDIVMVSSNTPLKSPRTSSLNITSLQISPPQRSIMASSSPTGFRSPRTPRDEKSFDILNSGVFGTNNKGRKKESTEN